MPKPSWYHFACLLTLLLVGCGIRLKNLTKNAVWRDEYWALYLATGRGDTLFQIPSQTIVQNPPEVGLNAAPHWWHIWNGLHSVIHPPFYYLLLRSWVDLFGQSDRSIRMLSVLFGLLAIGLIFDSVRSCAGASSGVIAAAILTFAPTQIDFSQQARPYTLMACIALAICNVLLRIEKHGQSPIKLAWLAIFIVLAAMTHYFDLGIILAAGIYVLWSFKGPVRRQTIAVIVAVRPDLRRRLGPQLPPEPCRRPYRPRFHRSQRVASPFNPRCSAALAPRCRQKWEMVPRRRHGNSGLSSAPV